MSAEGEFMVINPDVFPALQRGRAQVSAEGAALLNSSTVYAELQRGRAQVSAEGPSLADVVAPLRLSFNGAALR